MQKPKKKLNIQIQKQTVNNKKLNGFSVHNQQEKTLYTTKEMTYATLQEQVQNNQIRVHTHLNSNFQKRKTCLQRMQANHMSPFSSTERKSLSPQIKKITIENIIKQSPKCKKEAKNKKKKSPKMNKTSKSKRKSICSSRVFLQNEILRQQACKITQLSEQQADTEIEKLKINKQLLTYKKPLYIDVPFSKNQNKNVVRGRITQLHLKIKSQCRMNYPTLHPKFQKFLSCIILIQRLWRSRKIKSFFKQYSSPRKNQTNQSSKTYNNTRQKANIKQLKYSKELITKFQYSELIQSFSQQLTKNNKTFSCVKPQENINKIKLEDFEVSNTLSSSRESYRQKYFNFVEKYRTLNMMKLKKNKSKQNSFNFPLSMSEKCLMQKFYRKIFKSSDKTEKTIKFFTSSSKKQKNQKQNSIYKLQKQQIYSQKDKKINIQDIQPQNLIAKFNEKQNQFRLLNFQKAQFINKQKQAQNIQTKDQQQKQQCNTIQNINQISNSIVNILIKQFVQEFYPIKQCNKQQKKKEQQKKRRLPGVQLSNQYIQNYLQGLTKYIKQNYMDYLQQRFSKVNPMTFLRLCRAQQQQCLFYDKQDQQFSDWSLLPNTLFFEYQNIYEKEKFSIKQNDKKYQNFILSLIKIQNKCLHDSMLQYLQRNRSSRVLYTWDNDLQTIHTKKSVKQLVQSSIQNILQYSKYRFGSLYKNKQFEQQQDKFRVVERKQFDNETLEWTLRDQKLQFRLQITEAIFNNLMKEVAQQILKK